MCTAAAERVMGKGGGQGGGVDTSALPRVRQQLSLLMLAAQVLLVNRDASTPRPGCCAPELKTRTFRFGRVQQSPHM